ncbi:hypothetical protein [Salinarimonas rosea]|uniref:hypothetical protein n=1 Tax=Salinarimonas rosea TaxID=552063 RepID=UPI00041EA871|nr:hypothetical protein [Salinarimonas rosea]
MLHRELISPGMAARLFLVGALVLVCAYLRPVDAASLPAPASPACVAAPQAVAVLDAPVRDASLRLESARAQTLAPKLSRDGRPAPRRPRVPTPSASPRPPARRERGGGSVGPGARPRAHAARGPPGMRPRND